MKLNLALLLGLCCLLSVVFAQDVPETDGGPLPDEMDPDFPTDCESQRELRDHISCEDDGSFTPIQCNNRFCRCVDQETGTPINGVTFEETSEAPEYDCFPPEDEEDPGCPVVTCTLECIYGFVENEDGCEICECLPRPDDEIEDDDDDETTGDTTGSEDSTSGGCSRCPGVRYLVERGCLRACVYLNADGCPACNRTCVALGDTENEDECNSTEDCEDNELCLSSGPYGQRLCVELLQEGERCDGGGEDDEEESSDSDSDSSISYSEADESSSRGRGRGRARRRLAGASDRYLVSRMGSADIGCAPGLVCTRVGLDRRECRPVNENGTCVQAGETDPEAKCDDDGNFEPLQCRAREEGDFTCVCVRPDGSEVEGTEGIFGDPDDAPDCDDLVNERCEYEVGDREYSVRHGEYFFKPGNCSRCLCDDGEATFCEYIGDCDFAMGQRSCDVEGTELAHGDTFEVDCNRCGCRNGRIRCTHRNCDDDDNDGGDDDNDDDDDDDNDGSCSSCRTQRRSPVCASDGRTYQSQCYAIFCAGHFPVDLLRGPCTSYDVCELYPCNEGEICLRRGGVSCFNRNGCDPEDVRLCVDPAELMCYDDDEDDDDESGDGIAEVPESDGENPEEIPDEEEDEDTYICSTNCRSYRSICRMVQDTLGIEQVSYAGRCDREECSGGPVCGTDGVTYENICVLRGRSSARLDYEGECHPDSESPVDELCVRVSRARRCAYNESNCRHMVRPEEGCCALCGGIIYVAIDFSGLSEYVRINPRIRTVDALIEVLIESGFISEAVTNRCIVEGQLTDVGNLEIALSARDEDQDSEFCNEQSDIIRDNINDPSSAEIPPPELLQFASAASTSSLITVVEEEENPDQTPSGAPGLVVSFLALLASLLAVSI